MCCSHTEIPRWVEEVGGTGPNLFNRLMMIRFVTEFANEQLFYGVRNAVPFFLLELVSMVCISSCIASLCMNLNKGHTVAFVSCALASALASYMIFQVWHMPLSHHACVATLIMVKPF